MPSSTKCTPVHQHLYSLYHEDSLLAKRAYITTQELLTLRRKTSFQDHSLHAFKKNF